jgi:hypothetical protein
MNATRPSDGVPLSYVHDDQQGAAGSPGTSMPITPDASATRNYLECRQMAGHVPSCDIRSGPVKAPWLSATFASIPRT